MLGTDSYCWRPDEIGCLKTCNLNANALWVQSQVVSRDGMHQKLPGGPHMLIETARLTSPMQQPCPAPSTRDMRVLHGVCKNRDPLANTELNSLHGNGKSTTGWWSHQAPKKGGDAKPLCSAACHVQGVARSLAGSRDQLFQMLVQTTIAANCADSKSRTEPRSVRSSPAGLSAMLDRIN